MNGLVTIFPRPVKLSGTDSLFALGSRGPVFNFRTSAPRKGQRHVIGLVNDKVTCFGVLA